MSSFPPIDTSRLQLHAEKLPTNKLKTIRIAIPKLKILRKSHIKKSRRGTNTGLLGTKFLGRQPTSRRHIAGTGLLLEK